MDEKLKLSIELLSSILKNSKFEVGFREFQENPKVYEDLVLNITDVKYQTKIMNKSITVQELLRLIYSDIDSFIGWHENELKKSKEFDEAYDKLKVFVDKDNK